MTQICTVSIESLSYGGDAVARLEDGRVAFVKGGVPGDIASIRVTDDHKRFARAQIAELLEPSAARVSPPCPYFGACGGCQWQHIAYETQLEAKRAAVVDALQRIGRAEDADSIVASTTPSPAQYGYRNKVELQARTAEAGLQLGFFAAGSEDLVPIDTCLLLPKRAQKFPKAVRGALRYLQGTGDLGIERVGLRVAAKTSDVEVALWTPTGGFPRAQAAKMLETAVKASSVVRVIGKSARGRTVNQVEVLGGRGFWRERLGAFEYAISAPSFFQVNTAAADQLVRLALDALAPDDTDTALDLYSGAGTFTLPLAQFSGSVSAVESDGFAVRDLRRNLENAQLWADVIGGDAERELEALGLADVALVDPPRAGLSEGAVSLLASSGARRIAYVSCDPPTLARDVARFSSAGYRLVSATPVDLFPQTWHIETLAVFEPRP